jgi:hypothetical protein
MFPHSRDTTLLQYRHYTSQDTQTIADMEQGIDEKLWALRERESAEGEAAFDRMVNKFL